MDFGLLLQELEVRSLVSDKNYFSYLSLYAGSLNLIRFLDEQYNSFNNLWSITTFGLEGFLFFEVWMDNTLLFEIYDFDD